MGFLSGALGSIISGGTSLLSMPLQDYYNRKSASKANDYNWSMWQATNEYNTPANQMKRFEEAGLNKNLIYGQTNTTSPVSMSGPTAPDAQGALSKAGQSIMDYYAIKNAKASNDKLNAEIAGINAGIKNQNVKTMSDFWDLMQRVKGGYGSQDSSIYRTISPVFKAAQRGNSYMSDNFGKGYSEKHPVEVYDKSKPALGRNVKSVPKEWKPTFWPF